MAELTKEEINSAKARGFLRNRGTACFSGRVVSPGGVFTPEQLECIAGCARQFGSGAVAFTSRQSAEIPGIPHHRIDDACACLAEARLSFGGTGAKVRPVTACKGTTCVFGCSDTQKLAQELHNRFYLGWGDVPLPHKFKIGVGGCPNSCMKPSLNDLGIEARRSGDGVQYQLYAGGTWGRKTRVGTPLSRLVPEGEIFAAVEAVLHWYKDNAQQKERLGATIDRLGIEELENAVFNR